MVYPTEPLYTGNNVMRLLCFCITLGALLANSACFGDVPPELKAVVEYQKKNKNAVANSIQQEALRLKRAGDAEGAKAMKTIEKDVRANRALFLPKISPNADMAGTVEVEKVVQKTDGGYWIQTSLPRLENTSVNVNTGMRGTNPMFMGWVYYPEKIFVETAREPKADDRILVRRTGMSYVEITAEEVKEATAMLKD
jgi:hypothetical protein